MKNKIPPALSYTYLFHSVVAWRYLECMLHSLVRAEPGHYLNSVVKGFLFSLGIALSRTGLCIGEDKSLSTLLCYFMGQGKHLYKKHCTKEALVSICGMGE